MAVVASHNPSYHKAAVLTTELSFAANLLITVVFWGLLWNMLLQMVEEMEKTKGHTYVIFFLTQEALLHSMPMITVSFNMLVSDIGLYEGDWKKAAMVIFPAYMITNYIGYLNTGNSFYGVEDWGNKFGLTVFLFGVAALLQGSFYYIAALVINKFTTKK